MNEFESRIADELRARAQHVEGMQDASGPSLADGARSRAATIRTRRYVAAGAVAAVAIGIGVPAALSLGGTPHTAPLPAGTPTSLEPTTPAPTPTAPDPTTPPPSTPPPSDPPTEPATDPTDPADPPPPRGGTTTLTLDGLPAGQSPTIGWVDGSTFHHPDGGEIAIPEGVGTPLAFGDGLVGRSSRNEGDQTVVFVDGAGTRTEYLGYGPAVTADGSLIAWFDQETGRLRFAQTDGGGTGPSDIPVPADQVVEPVGFLDDSTLISNVKDAEGTLLGVRRDVLTGGDPGRGDTPPWDVELVSAVSEAAQLVVGITSTDDAGMTCSAVYSAETDNRLWDTCEYSFDHFSPDGRYLVGAHSYRDGPGHPFVVIIDAHTRELVHRFDGVEGNHYITRAAFEDDEHLLISVSSWFTDVEEPTVPTAILRCTLDGACETATDIRQVGVDEWPFGFGTQP